MCAVVSVCVWVCRCVSVCVSVCVEGGGLSKRNVQQITSEGPIE